MNASAVDPWLSRFLYPVKVADAEYIEENSTAGSEAEPMPPVV